MTPTHRRAKEQGSALVLALFLIVILTVLGLGLILRTRVTMAVAAAERPITKNFYAADGAVHAAYARLQTRNPCPFTFTNTDTRGGGGGYPMNVNVDRSLLVNSQRAVGSEAGGGISGGGTSLVMLQYRLATDSFEAATQTRRAVEAEVVLGPTVPGIEPPCS